MNQDLPYDSLAELGQYRAFKRAYGKENQVTLLLHREAALTWFLVSTGNAIVDPADSDLVLRGTRLWSRSCLLNVLAMYHGGTIPYMILCLSKECITVRTPEAVRDCREGFECGVLSETITTLTVKPDHRQIVVLRPWRVTLWILGMPVIQLNHMAHLRGWCWLLFTACCDLWWTP